MPRGQERVLIYIRERDGAGRTVIRAVEAPRTGPLEIREPDPPMDKRN